MRNKLPAFYVLGICATLITLIRPLQAEESSPNVEPLVPIASPAVPKSAETLAPTIDADLPAVPSEAILAESETVTVVITQLEEQLGFGYRGSTWGIKLKHRFVSEYNLGFYYDAQSALTRVSSLVLEVRHVEKFSDEFLIKYGGMLIMDQSTVAAQANMITRLGLSLGLERYWQSWFSTELNFSPLVLRVQNGIHIDGIFVTLGAYLHLFEKWRDITLKVPALPSP